MTLRLAWFATGSGTTSPKLLRAGLEAIRSGRLNAEITVVFCNREPGEDPMSDAYCAEVESAGLPLVRLSDRRYRTQLGGEVARKGRPLPRWRKNYDLEVMRRLDPYDFDLGMLAGYKLIFGEEASAQWDLLNLHPAMPGGPAGLWQDVIWKLIETQARQAGVMIHLATPDLDEGPVVTYCRYNIDGDSFETLRDETQRKGLEAARTADGENLPLFQAIREAGVAREVPLVIETLRAVADGRIRIVGKRVVDEHGTVIDGYDLTNEIEALVNASS